MKRMIWLLLSVMMIKAVWAQQKYVLAIHGGAGTILRQNMMAEKEAAYKAALEKALLAGYAKLKQGKSSIDAVEAAIRVMEDSPLFNAGKGAVFTNDGRNELDASIMDGKSLAAGSIAGVWTIRNPISAARAVMEQSPHVMMAGRGAEKFAKEKGLEIVAPRYFFTQERFEGLKKAKEKEAKAAKEKIAAVPLHHDEKFGTVGCVALDSLGNLAAGTSTGGMTNKRFGRIGDAPIIGAGTYANNKTVAISCTGWGEYFIRSVVAHDISALMEYKGISVKDAAETVLKKVAALGGDGGLIALDKDGKLTMPFNTAGMYRAAITADGKIEIAIYRD